MFTTTHTTQAFRRAEERLNAIAQGDGWLRSNDGQWLCYTYGNEMCSYAAALEAEELVPADVDNGRGWMFGEGIPWLNVVECDLTDKFAIVFGDCAYMLQALVGC